MHVLKTLVFFHSSLLFSSPCTPVPYYCVRRTGITDCFDWQVVVLTASCCYGYLVRNIIVVDNAKVSALHSISIK